MNYFWKQPISFFLCFAVIGLTGCVDLSRAKLNPERKIASYSTKPVKHKTKAHASKSQGEVHTMLGGLGMFSVGMSDVRDDIAKQYGNVSASSNMWYNGGDVAYSIKRYYYTHKKHRPIILVGHSLGANEQIKVARNLNAAGIPVDLLVTVDAVSQTIVPPNVKHVVNLYKTGYVPMFSGLKLKAVDSRATKIENINVDDLKGVSVNHFTIDKNEVVQAMILDEVKKVLVDGNKKRA
ncbi:hypothetical protein [Legionella fallonii]